MDQLYAAVASASSGPTESKDGVTLSTLVDPMARKRKISADVPPSFGHDRHADRSVESASNATSLPPLSSSHAQVGLGAIASFALVEAGAAIGMTGVPICSFASESDPQHQTPKKVRGS